MNIHKEIQRKKMEKEAIIYSLLNNTSIPSEKVSLLKKGVRRLNKEIAYLQIQKNNGKF